MSLPVRRGIPVIKMSKETFMKADDGTLKRNERT